MSAAGYFLSVDDTKGHRRSISIGDRVTSVVLEDSMPVPSPPNLGSLLRLFKSDFFDSWIAISYLFRYKTPGVHDYLCNELYNTPAEDIEFYLPELCILMIYENYNSDALERFIMDKCKHHLHFALRLNWILGAELDYAEEYRTRCEYLQDCCSKATQHCSSLTQSADYSKESDGTLSNHRRSFSMINLQEETFAQTKKMQDKASYFKKILSFVEMLGDISSRLRGVPLDKRQLSLEKELECYNEEFPIGVYLPLWDVSSLHYCICRVVPQESKTLNSRDRVPFILTFEAIEGEETVSEQIHDAAKFCIALVDEHMKESEEIEYQYPNSETFKDSPFGEPFEEKENRIRNCSPYGDIYSWKLKRVIVKYGDDCRQEFLAMQLIRQFKHIFDNANLPLYLQPYSILISGTSSGLIEVVNDAISIHQLKKFYRDNTEVQTLKDHFKSFCGTDTEKFHSSVKNFVESLAGYSLVSFLLQLKDRHNGNIMITSSGHLVHIDFGYMLSLTPGGINAENAPFKFTQDYLAVMGGLGSPMYKYFKQMLFRGYLEARKHHEKIILLVEMMSVGSKLPCFTGDDTTVVELRERFNLSMPEKEIKLFIDNMVLSSQSSWRTKGYDTFQYYTNGILQ